jgi:hypothetical protein
MVSTVTAEDEALIRDGLAVRWVGRKRGWRWWVMSDQNRLPLFFTAC